VEVNAIEEGEINDVTGEEVLIEELEYAKV
jgi:hypothetical protein